MKKTVKLTDKEKIEVLVGKALVNANYDAEKETVNYENEYEGFLTLYFETGMEGLAPILQEDKPTDIIDGEKKYSLKNSIFLKGGEYLQIFDKDGNIEWEGLLIPTIEQFKHHLHLLPDGMTKEQWVGYCNKEHKAKVFTNDSTLEDKNL